ncbi:hypothetical protein ACFL2G_02445 [Candidatus Omnitrophota bacterium]
MKKKKAKKKVARKKKTVKRKKKKKVARKPKKKIIKKKAKTKSKLAIPAGMSLEEIGIVTHYFGHVEAAVIKLTKGSLSLGDTIVIKGHTTEFKEKIDSMQLDRAPITSASIGQEVGLRVKARTREHDAVYKLVG